MNLGDGGRVQKEDALEIILELAPTLKHHTEHQPAIPIFREARQRHQESKKAEAFRTLPGKGVKGTIEDIRYHLGNQTMMQDL